VSSLKQDDDHWGLPPQLPPRGRVRPARNHRLGLVALVAAIGTLIFELRLFGLGLSPLQTEITWLPVALIATIVLCIVAGARHARAYGVVGGLLVLSPFLYLFGLWLTAYINNTR